MSTSYLHGKYLSCPLLSIYCWLFLTLNWLVTSHRWWDYIRVIIDIHFRCNIIPLIIQILISYSLILDWPVVFPLLCCADDWELYNQIIDIRREIARPEALVMIVTTTTNAELLPLAGAWFRPCQDGPAAGGERPAADERPQFAQREHNPRLPDRQAQALLVQRHQRLQLRPQQ